MSSTLSPTKAAPAASKPGAQTAPPAPKASVRKKIFSSFRARLTLFIASLVITSVGSASVYLLRLYRADRLGAAYEQELNSIIQSGSRLESLILGAGSFTPDRVETSREILGVVEGVCTTAPAPVFSKYFREILDKQKIPLDQALDRIADRVGLCQGLPIKDPQIGAVAHGALHLAVPYLIFRQVGLNGEHWAIVSLESVDVGSIAGGMQLFDSENHLLWSSSNAQQPPPQIADIIARAPLEQPGASRGGRQAPAFLLACRQSLGDGARGEQG